MQAFTKVKVGLVTLCLELLHDSTYVSQESLLLVETFKLKFRTVTSV
jgi:hypothetical protein